MQLPIIKQIALNDVEQIKQFVTITSRYPFDMDVRAKRYVVDAKSIIGILSLGREPLLYLDIYEEDISVLLDALKPFLVS